MNESSDLLSGVIGANPGLDIVLRRIERLTGCKESSPDRHEIESVPDITTAEWWDWIVVHQQLPPGSHVRERMQQSEGARR
jgi:hypothetical protein